MAARQPQTHLILFGPPGSGKGTQAALLVEKMGFRHLSTGEAFRAAIRSGSPLGRQVQEIVRSGKLVSDEIVSQIVREEARTALAEGVKFIFDGYPRTLQQVDSLDALLREARSPEPVVISLDVDDEEVIKRLSGRRQCKECGAIYNVHYKSPLRNGFCDSCGGEVTQRPDDSTETVRERLRVYHEQTRPVLDTYKERGSLRRVQGDGSASEVFGRMARALEAAHV